MHATKFIYYLLALLAGASLALEVAFGGVLGHRIGKLETSWLIFLMGFLILLPYVLARKRHALSQLKFFKKWELSGGFWGAAYLVLLLVCVTRLGVGLSMAAVVVGQLVVGSILEQFGWLNLKVSKFNNNTMTAFVLLIVALVLIVKIGMLDLEGVLWILAPVLAGGMLTIQAAINGNLGQKVGTETSTMMSFLLGSVALGVVVLIRGQFSIGEMLGVPVWQWLTLLWGILFVFLMVLVVPQIGVVVTSVLVIAGQLFVSMIIDHFGLFGNQVILFDIKRLIGTVLMLGALYFIFRAKRWVK